MTPDTRTPPARGVLHVRWVRKPLPQPEWIGYAAWPTEGGDDAEEDKPQG